MLEFTPKGIKIALHGYHRLLENHQSVNKSHVAEFLLAS